GLLHRVSDDQKAGDLSVDRDEHHARAHPAMSVRPTFQRGSVDSEFLHERSIAECHLAAGHGARDPLAGARLKVLARRQFKATLLGAIDNRRREWMLAPPLQ